MSKRKEKRLSALAFLIAKGVSENELNHYQCTDISFQELKELEKRFDFACWIKAHLHNLQACSSYEKDLSLPDAMGTVVLSSLTPNERSREDVLDLLDALGVENSESFLVAYEELHGVYWESNP